MDKNKTAPKGAALNESNLKLMTYNLKLSDYLSVNQLRSSPYTCHKYHCDQYHHCCQADNYPLYR